MQHPFFKMMFEKNIYQDPGIFKGSQKSQDGGPDCVIKAQSPFDVVERETLCSNGAVISPFWLVAPIL